MKTTNLENLEKLLPIAKKHLTTLVEIDIIKVLNVEGSRKSCFLVEPFRKIDTFRI